MMMIDSLQNNHEKVDEKIQQIQITAFDTLWYENIIRCVRIYIVSFVFESWFNINKNIPEND